MSGRDPRTGKNTKERRKLGGKGNEARRGGEGTRCCTGTSFSHFQPYFSAVFNAQLG